MSIPPLLNSQIQSEKPLAEAVMKEGLRDRDRWLRSAATAGAGIAPNVEAFEVKLMSHRHDATTGQGAKIPAAGIASDAVFDPDMIGAGQVSQAKVAGSTMNTGNLADGSVTSEKISGTTSEPFSGTFAYNTELEPDLDTDDEFKGQTKTISNPIGHLGVIAIEAPSAATAGEFHIRKVTASEIKLGINRDICEARYGTVGVWSYAGRITGRF